jgi:hypothetical protein
MNRSIEENREPRNRPTEYRQLIFDKRANIIKQRKRLLAANSARTTRFTYKKVHHKYKLKMCHRSKY